VIDTNGSISACGRGHRAALCGEVQRLSHGFFAGGARRGRGGFSVVELLIVIALMVVLAGIVVPRFSGLRAEAELWGGVEEIGSAVGAARADAMRTGRPRTIEIVQIGGREGPGKAEQAIVARWVVQRANAGVDDANSQAGVEMIWRVPAELGISGAREGDEGRAGGVLAVAMPSGEVMLGAGPAWRVRHRDGRELTLRVGRWTGEVVGEAIGGKLGEEPVEKPELKGVEKNGESHGVTVPRSADAEEGTP
jgi:hypothetical protein